MRYLKQNARTASKVNNITEESRQALTVILVLHSFQKLKVLDFIFFATFCFNITIEKNKIFIYIFFPTSPLSRVMLSNWLRSHFFVKDLFLSCEAIMTLVHLSKTFCLAQSTEELCLTEQLVAFTSLLTISNYGHPVHAVTEMSHEYHGSQCSEPSSYYYFQLSDFISMLSSAQC